MVPDMPADSATALGPGQNIRTTDLLRFPAFRWYMAVSYTHLDVYKRQVVGAFFPLYITTYLGIRSIDPRLIEVAQIFGLTRGELIRHVLLPAALPSVLVGVRMAFGLMWMNLIVVETIATDKGIGYLINNAREFMQTDIIVLGILLYALLGKAADSTVRLFERRFVTWKSQFAGV